MNFLKQQALQKEMMGLPVHGLSVHIMWPLQSNHIPFFLSYMTDPKANAKCHPRATRLACDWSHRKCKYVM